ncbi:50S ribosomal protein L10 [bacterium]|nr:50S ribosomal protein L10 [bacterium]
MAKSRDNKSELLKKYQSILSGHNGFLLVDTSNLDTLSITSLKMKLKDIGSDFMVIKNTIFKIALQNENKDIKLQDFDGQTALIVVGDDPSAAAKLVKEVQADKKLMNARMGLFQTEFLSSERVMALADIPSREVLLAKLLGSLNSPLTGFMNAATGNARGFVFVLKGLSEKGN